MAAAKSSTNHAASDMTYEDVIKNAKVLKEFNASLLDFSRIHKNRCIISTYIDHNTLSGNVELKRRELLALYYTRVSALLRAINKFFNIKAPVQECTEAGDDLDQLLQKLTKQLEIFPETLRALDDFIFYRSPFDESTVSTVKTTMKNAAIENFKTWAHVLQRIRGVLFRLMKAEKTSL